MDNDVIATAQSKAEKAYLAWLNHSTQDALQITWEIIALANKYITEKEPWKKMKENKREEVEQLLRTEIELLRIISILIAPILPLTNERLQEQFGFFPPQFSQLKQIQPLEGKPVKKGAVLFAKKELPKSAQ